jgi:hypothetical protein
VKLSYGKKAIIALGDIEFSASGSSCQVPDVAGNAQFLFYVTQCLFYVIDCESFCRHDGDIAFAHSDEGDFGRASFPSIGSSLNRVYPHDVKYVFQTFLS